MDINEKIAARRAELARLEREADAETQAAKVQAEAIEAARREAAAVALVAEINAGDEVEATHQGETVALVRTPDLTGWSPEMKQAALMRLFQREARRRWTPTDQWLAISLVAGGVCLIHVAGIGLVAIAAGLWCRARFNRRCREELREEYPELFGALPER